MDSKNVYVCLVVLYNPERNIEHQLIIYSQCFDKVILFDNSAKQADWLNSLIINNNNIDYYNYGENIGISGALNETMKLVVDTNFGYLATMDQDTVFDKEDIIRMKNHIDECKDNDIAVFATNFRKTYFGKGGVEYSDYKYSQNGIYDVRFHLSSGNFLNISLVKNIFPLDNLFIAFVDFDLDYAIHLKGWKLRVFGDCFITQQIGNRIKANFLSKYGLTDMSVDRFYYLVRNNLYFSKKYCEYKEARKFAIRKRIIYLLKIILSEKNKFAKLKMMKRGYKDYKLNKLGPVGPIK